MFLRGELYIGNLVLIIRVKRCPPKTTSTVSFTLGKASQFDCWKRSTNLDLDHDHEHDHDHDHDHEDEMPELENQGKHQVITFYLTLRIADLIIRF